MINNGNPFATPLPQDFDMVLFLGKNSAVLKGLTDIVPTLHGMVNLDVYESRMKGIVFSSYTITDIDPKRISSHPISIDGKRTLVVRADFFSKDQRNSSFVDVFLEEQDVRIKQLENEMKFIKQENDILTTFIKKHNLVDNFKEELQNLLNFYKMYSVKVAGKSEQTPVEVSVGEKSSDKKS